jgi:DNA-binding MarR family transcriptional regulator
MSHKAEHSSSLEQSATNGPTPRLGYLLKQAHQRFLILATEAIAPLGIDTRQWAVLNYLTEERGYSQGEVAQRLGVDRTTMVALVDELQHKGLVAREPHPEDRRKNRVELTLEGRDVLKRGAPCIDDAERRFLAVLSQAGTRQFRSALQAVTRSDASIGDP